VADAPPNGNRWPAVMNASEARDVRHAAGTPPRDEVARAAMEPLAADWADAARLAADWPVRDDPGHVDRITQVLVQAGVCDPTVLLAGALLGAVRDGGCPLARVQRRFGERVAVLIARQLPPPRAPSAYQRSPRSAVVPPEWRRVARELPGAAELLALADLCALRRRTPQAGRAATSGPEPACLPGPRQAPA